MKKHETKPTGPGPRATRQASSRSRGKEKTPPRDSSVHPHRPKSPKNTAPLREQTDLLQLTHDSIIVRNLDDAITFWNRGAVDQYGWTESDALGQVTHVLLQTQFPQPLEEIRAQLLRSGRWEGELAHIRRDGTRIIVASRWALQRDADGQPVAILEINNDITERKRAEDQRRQLNAELEQRVTERTAKLKAANGQLEEEIAERQSEILARVQAEERARHLASFPELNPNPVMEVDAFGKIIFANPATHQILEKLGMDPGNVRPLLPADMDSILSDWDKKSTASHYQEIVVNNKVFGETITLIPQFEVARVYAYDITERKRAEELALYQATLVDNANDAIISSDENFCIRTWNKAAEALFGWRAEEVIGKRSSDVLPAKVQGGEDRQAAAKDFLEKGVWRGEVIYQRKDGRKVHTLVSSVALRDSHGKINGALAIHTDITERKETEEQILKLNQQLEQRARDLENANEELEVTNEELKVANEDLGKEIIERKLAERAALQAQEEWERTFDSVPDLIAIIDNQHRIVRANRAMAERLGLTPDQCIGRECYRAVHGLEGPPGFCPHVLTLADGQTHAAEIHEPRLKGDFLVTTTPLTDDHGGSIGSVHVARDITARKQAEEALRVSEERFRRYFELGLIGMTITSPTKGIVEVNDELCRILGYERNKLLQMTWAELTHPDDLAADIAQFNQVMAGEIDGYSIDKRFLRKDGQVIDATISVRCLRRADGSVDYLVALLQDITERKRAEAEIRRLNESLRNKVDELKTLLEILPVGIWTGNRDCSQITGNPAAYQMMGFSPGINVSVTTPEPEVPPIKVLVNGVEMPPEEAPMQQVARSGKPLKNVEHEIVFPDGMKKTVYASVVPLFDQDGQVRGVIGAYSDFTERKLIEERILRLNEDLEQRAGELQVANEELERLATSLALDLRSPLVSLHSVSRLIAQDYGAQLPPQAQELFQLIDANAEEMDQLTQGLLQMMRLTRQTLRKQELNPEEIVRAALAELQPECEGRQVEFTVGHLPTCRADPLLLKQVWVNLLSNALKFTRPREQARIEIGARPEGNRFVYFVKDNGVGFDMSYAGTIFRAFQRYHHAEDWGGSGVGLAIVESIVRRHGGRVWAEGAVDQGATVYFTLM